MGGARWRRQISLEICALHGVATRRKTTSAQQVAARARDPTFEKLMADYKNLIKVFSIQDLILASPDQSISLRALTRMEQALHLNRGARAFIRKFPHIFEVNHDSAAKQQTIVKLTAAASLVSRQESAAADASIPEVVRRLVRLLSISTSKCLPLRAIFRLWRELGLPDDVEDSVLARHQNIFSLHINPRETNTHILKLVSFNSHFTPAVDVWRKKAADSDARIDETEIRYAFSHVYPPGMNLSKDYRAWVKKWQRLPYSGPYESAEKSNRTRYEKERWEKRAVGVVHEVLSLTVEKMVEVEKISHFRKWFDIDLNIRDLFLDHPGMFYLSTKGKRHTVFLREAYYKGSLIEPNPVFDARRRLLHLVLLGRRGISV